MQRTYHIWQEGAQMQGGGFDASYVGKITVDMGISFVTACQIFHINFPDDTYSPTSNRIWGCRLFDNEDDARQAYG
jgi:hypothetical protein